MNPQRSAPLVRWWVALYTLGLPPEARRDRRDEIDDDLWCQAQEAATNQAGRSIAGEMVARLVFGVPSDVSWRIEQGLFGSARPRPERSPAMNTRPPATLAIVGGVSWLVFLGLALPVGFLEGKYQGDPLLLLVLLLGGAVAMVVATIRLVAAAQDMISGSAASLAVVGATVVTIVLFGFVGLFVAPPLASAVVVWQLGHVGILPAWPSRAQMAAAIIIVVVAAIGRVTPVLGLYGVLLVLVSIALYAVTWVAIGWSLQRRRAAATPGAIGAGVA